MRRDAGPHDRGRGDQGQRQVRAAPQTLEDQRRHRRVAHPAAEFVEFLDPAALVAVGEDLVDPVDGVGGVRGQLPAQPQPLRGRAERSPQPHERHHQQRDRNADRRDRDQTPARQRTHRHQGGGRYHEGRYHRREGVGVDHLDAVHVAGQRRQQVAGTVPEHHGRRLRPQRREGVTSQQLQGLEGDVVTRELFRVVGQRLGQRDHHYPEQQPTDGVAGCERRHQQPGQPEQHQFKAQVDAAQH